MNIPPILERLLLSNEAVFKNATLGLSGQNMVFVPPGKTAVILEFSIEPFVNAVLSSTLTLFGTGQGTGANSFAVAYVDLIKRLAFQLQIINDNYATYFSFHDCFSVVQSGDGATTRATVQLQFKGKREDLFIYTDNSMYFNLIYPYQVSEIGSDVPGLAAVIGTPLANFLAKLQDLPEDPTTFKFNAFQQFIERIIVLSTGTDSYYPVGHQINGAEFNQQEYLRFYNSGIETTIVQPRPSGDDIQFGDLCTLPLINVKYALINKRPSDYGITPGKL